MNRADRLYAKAIRRIARYSFPLCERLGFHLVPIHYYQPIPDSRTLHADLSERTSELVGIDLCEAAQLQLLEEFAGRYKAEYDGLPRQPTGDPRDFYVNNSSFGAVDAEILYCMIRAHRPYRVVEIGGGLSTLLTAQVLEQNKGNGEPPIFISIDPYPSCIPLDRAVPGLTILYPTEVQAVSMSLFEGLGANDILFIDSSHLVRIDGDVNFEILEILPRLRPGVLVHLHDIYLPREYDVRMIKEHKVFMTEQYLLQAFLTFNPRFEILWAGNFMHVRHPDRLKAAFDSYRQQPAPPLSWWMKRTG